MCFINNKIITAQIRFHRIENAAPYWNARTAPFTTRIQRVRTEVDLSLIDAHRCWKLFSKTRAHEFLNGNDRLRVCETGTNRNAVAHEIVPDRGHSGMKDPRWRKSAVICSSAENATKRTYLELK